MDTLVPSYISLDGVDFPLEANQLSVGLAKGAEELEALRYALDAMVNGDSKDVPLETLAREGFAEQGASARPVTPEASLSGLQGSMISWRRMSGSWPDREDAFMATTNFTKRDIVVPRPVLIELVCQLRQLRGEILVGKREGRVDDTTVPPPRPLTPELEEYERLRSFSREDAEVYGEVLYARRG